MKVMIVDDSFTMRKIAKLALINPDNDFTEAENGQEALEKLPGLKYDLFIVDYNMPVMNGIAFVKTLRAIPDYSKTPVIMLTTESGDKLIQEGISAGVTAWMVKPFKYEFLLDMVRSLNI
jgi:two-component system chemotaxis response regulator CheY